MRETEQSPQDEWQDRSMNVVYRFVLALKELHESNPIADSNIRRSDRLRTQAARKAAVR